VCWRLRPSQGGGAGLICLSLSGPETEDWKSIVRVQREYQMMKTIYCFDQVQTCLHVCAGQIHIRKVYLNLIINGRMMEVGDARFRWWLGSGSRGFLLQGPNQVFVEQPHQAARKVPEVRSTAIRLNAWFISILYAR
jgi:hypothetical protein